MSTNSLSSISSISSIRPLVGGGLPGFSLNTVFQIVILIVVASIVIWLVTKALSLLPEPFRTYGTVFAYIVAGFVVCYYLLSFAGLV